MSTRLRSEHWFLPGVFALLAASGALAGPAGPLGMVSLSGTDATLNWSPLVSGATLYAGDRISLGKGTQAAIQLPGGLVLAAEHTRLVLTQTSVRLEQGRIQVRRTGRAALDVEGISFRVRLQPEKGAASAEVALEGSAARVTPVRGVAEVAAAGNPTVYRVQPGEAALVGTEVPASGPIAGQISRVIPEVRIHRGPQELMAARQMAVEWNDELRSGRGARARLALADGSILNLGSESTLRLLSHDAAKQQTQLQLNYGWLRARVVRLARPGATFEVRTPVAVAGVVGTLFALYATDQLVQAVVWEGSVRLTCKAREYSVTVNAGQKAVMFSDCTTPGPTVATPEELDEAQAATEVPDTPPAEPQTQGQPTMRKLPVVVLVSATAVASIVVPLVLGEESPSSPSPR